MASKIQSKIIHYIEQQGEYSGKRAEFSSLNKRYRELAPEQKPKDVTETVSSVVKDVSGKDVSVSKDVRKKVFPTEETKVLYEELRNKRKQILRFTKYSTLYINMVCDKMIEDFLHSCEPTQNKKTNEKTFGWKQFNRVAFQ